MIRVYFIEVGRAKRSWEVLLSELSERALYLSAKRGAGLRSSNVWFSDPDRETGIGVIFAGLHSVGHYRVSQVE